MQWTAMITMLIDHVGIAWFSDSPVWRVIGRLAFPIYTYYVALGMVRTKNQRNYVTRLAMLAAVSQIPFMILFQTTGINVIGTFFVSAAAIYIFERYIADRFTRYASFTGVALALELFAFDYGAYGLGLLLLYRYTKHTTMWSGHLAMNTAYWMLFGTPLQMFSILPTLLFAFVFPVADDLRTSPTVPRWLWRSFYPAHMLLLILLVVWTTQ